MADKTKIEWTGATWNPIRARRRDGTGNIGWHCEHASPGCVNCYAEKLNGPGWPAGVGTGLPYKPGHLADVEVYLDEKVLTQPLRWRKGRFIFPCSMTDIFGRFVTDEMLDRIFAVMALCPQHTFQVLTKRSARMREYFATRMGREVPAEGHPWALSLDAMCGADRQIKRITCDQRTCALDNLSAAVVRSHSLPNVWLGVSVEDQQRADERISDLLATPAAVRWLSCEPLLGPVNLRDVAIGPRANSVRVDALTGCEWDELGGRIDAEGVDWIVAGGESGPGARPMHPDWARSLRDQCAAAGVPFFFKQHGAWAASGEHNLETVLGGPEGAAHPRFKTCWVSNEPKAGRTFMANVGKKRAGRLLDGVEHNGMPEVAHG